MFFDDELPIIDFKSVKKMDGMAKTRLMEALHEEYENKVIQERKKQEDE